MGAGVIERLSQKNKDNQSSIEIKPASSVSSEKVSTAPNLEITLNQVKKEDLSPKPKLKLNIKIPSKHFDHRNDTDGSYPKMTTASPKLESSTFQIPKLNKLDSPNFKKDRPKHSFTKSPHSKINERFITDPSSVSSKRPEDRKRSSDRENSSSSSSQPAASSISGGLGESSPLSDSLLDEGLLMK